MEEFNIDPKRVYVSCKNYILHLRLVYSTSSCSFVTFQTCEKKNYHLTFVICNCKVIVSYLLTRYGISQLTLHQCTRALADCRDVISIVMTSSKYVGNFDHRSIFT